MSPTTMEKAILIGSKLAIFYIKHALSYISYSRDGKVAKKHANRITNKVND